MLVFGIGVVLTLGLFAFTKWFLSGGVIAIGVRVFFFWFTYLVAIEVARLLIVKYL